jgi:mono/diheme cytochrome c family protein
MWYHGIDWVKSNRRTARQVTGSVAALAAALIAACALIIAAPGFAQEEQPPPSPPPPATPQQIAAGKADFMKHCAPCHGENAKGHGPEVNIIPGIKPADLTLITTRNGGVFPFQKVEDTIDGRKKIPSHERFDMPFWGVNFQQAGQEFTPESEGKARSRIDALVSYLETIQAK